MIQKAGTPKFKPMAIIPSSLALEQINSTFSEIPCDSLQFF